MAKKPLEIDACAGSQLRDTQGEMLSVEGADISDLQAGKGRWNDNHGKGFFNSIGRITGAKKIFKEEDCEDDRQRYYWNKVKAPYIYVKGYLYSDEDHPNARAAAAILRNIHKSDVPLKLKASVEGGVLSRGLADPSLLARTKIHSVALTFTPANNATLVEPLSVEKSLDDAGDMELIKSVIHLAETNVPSFRHIARDASAARVRANLERIVELMKGDDSIDLPTKQEILQYALESKIQSNVAKIHDIVEQIRHENMEKGLKDAVMGAAMMGATALNPTPAHAPTPAVQQQPAQQVNLSKMPPEHQAAYRAAAKRNPLLGAIGQVESSGGLNYAHKTIENGGMHQGQTAGGMFGMMPNAAEYILRNDPKLASKYPRLLEASKDMKTNHGVFTKTFNENPQAAIDFAEALLARNKAKTKNPEMLIHSWNHGLKGTWERYKNEGPQAVRDADYVKSVMKEFAKFKKPSNKPVQAKKAPKMKKALTAGYGGAAAPTSRVGGAVIQSENLDSGHGGFKYVTCDGCGKEQIYAKHQVKCRDCGKSWSLDKLHQVMLGLKR